MKCHREPCLYLIIYSHLFFIWYFSHFIYIAEITHSILNFLLVITQANNGGHIRSSFIYTRVNLQTVIKSQRTSVVTSRPVNQRWKTGEYSSVTSQFSSLLVEPEFEIQSNIIPFPFFPDNHLYLLMELPTPIQERAKSLSNSKTLRKGNGDVFI